MRAASRVLEDGLLASSALSKARHAAHFLCEQRLVTTSILEFKSQTSITVRPTLASMPSRSGRDRSRSTDARSPGRRSRACVCASAWFGGDDEATVHPDEGREQTLSVGRSRPSLRADPGIIVGPSDAGTSRRVRSDDADGATAPSLCLGASFHAEPAIASSEYAPRCRRQSGPRRGGMIAPPARGRQFSRRDAWWAT